MSYSEQVRWPAWCHLLLWLGIVICMVGGAVPLADGSFVGLPALLVGVVLAAVWLGMRVLVVEAGPEGLAYGFLRPRRRIEREQIVEAAAADYAFSRYMGWGYRIGWQRGERAYALIGYRRGLRVRYTTEKGERIVFLSCSDPERAVLALGPKK
ncbi:MAG: hypothetical protein ACYTGN_03735 [Planctomycetota bacterium]|jgi:hypothetical protein